MILQNIYLPLISSQLLLERFHLTHPIKEKAGHKQGGNRCGSCKGPPDRLSFCLLFLKEKLLCLKQAESLGKCFLMLLIGTQPLPQSVSFGRGVFVLEKTE